MAIISVWFAVISYLRSTTGMVRWSMAAKLKYFIMKQKAATTSYKLLAGGGFTISKAHEPALPPFSHPSMSKFGEEDGIYPDLETLLMEIPEDHESSKLYISGDVEFIEPTEGMDESQQWELGEIVRTILRRVGLILKVDDETFTNWIESSPIMDLIDEKPDAIFAVSGMLLGDLDIRQEILEAKDVEEVMVLLHEELEKFSEEE